MNSNKEMLEKVRELEIRLNLDLSDVRVMLEDNVREEAVKKSKRNKNELSIVKNLFKDRFYKFARPTLINKTFMSGEFYTYMTEHRVFYTRTDLGYEVAENDYHFNFVEDFARDIVGNEKVVSIDIDVEKLNVFIETHSKKDNTPYIIKIQRGNHSYWLGVNPRYLMDSIKFTENNNIMFVVGGDSHVKCPIYNCAVDDTELLTKLVVTLPVHCGNLNNIKADYSYLVS